MPLIYVTVPEGVLDDAKKQTLISDLTDAVLTVEGVPPVAELRSLGWVFLHEAPPGTWAVGGQTRGKLKFLVTITTVNGLLDAERKRVMAEEVYNVLKNVADESLDPREAWVVINEVADGNWSAGGKVYRLDDFAKYLQVAAAMGQAA